ncbi:hypothetical protein QUF79_14485 [Fictibacillus enclensis]|uniref:hypothetical protein n=1 Tax=Fictibacillus enclensis TaxID=1017270 RepID=UPI0025A2785D|nr:hypothetical protein [Fictibacillus enclensis]MDM5199225.1 hypothetical protein [Fictibacillus enclensis]
MSKVKSVKWNEFFKGEIVPKEPRKLLIHTGIGTIFLVNKASVAYAASEIASNNGLGRLMTEILGLTDYIAWGGLIFAGAAWMTNNRTVAIERAVGVTAGYLIIRKSWSYVMFLKGL